MNEDFRIRRSGEAGQRLLSNVDFRVFLEGITEHAEAIAEKVLVSGCGTFEDYQKQSGFYAGVSFALNWAREASEELSELLEQSNES